MLTLGLFILWLSQKYCCFMAWEGAKPRGLTKENLDRNCQACKLNKGDAMDHTRWKQIRDD